MERLITVSLILMSASSSAKEVLHFNCSWPHFSNEKAAMQTLVVLALFIFSLSSFADRPIKITGGVSQWLQVGDEARLVWFDDQGGMTIFFSKVNEDRDCASSYGLITARSRKLGAHIKTTVAKSSKNKLNVVIGGEEYTGRTAMAQHSNGLEVQMGVEDGLFDFGRKSFTEQFADNKSFSVQFGSQDPFLKGVRHKGYSNVYRQLIRNCLN